MKKLYYVQITVMVMADSCAEAAEVAAREATSEDCDAMIATSIPWDWNDAIPFGSDDDATCGAVLERQDTSE